jgi:tetratricopeptide (TPR) repeat protein
VFGCTASCFLLAGCGDRLNEAHALEQRGDLTGALQVYTEIIGSEPDDQAAIEGAAVCLFALRRFDEALVLEEKLATLDPTNAQIRVELGFNYLNHQDRPGDAVRVLAEAAELEPSAKNLCFLAQAHVAAGDAGMAEQVLREAIDMEPDYAYSYRLLIGLLQGQGRIEEADEVAKLADSRGLVLTETPDS